MMPTLLAPAGHLRFIKLVSAASQFPGEVHHSHLVMLNPTSPSETIPYFNLGGLTLDLDHYVSTLEHSETSIMGSKE